MVSWTRDKSRLVLELLTICLAALIPSVAMAWQYTLSGPGYIEDRFLAVTVDQQGEVYAAGWSGTTTCFRSFTVVKVSGETGEPIWTHQFCGSVTDGGSVFANNARWLAPDPTGAVLASGHVENSDGFAGTIVRLAGATGAETWRATPAPEAAFLALDPSGDLAVQASTSCPGSQNPPDSVMKLSGKDGSIIWCKGIATTGEVSGRVMDLVADPSGNFVAVGRILKASSPSHLDSLVALKLAGANGNEIWRYESDQDLANHVTLDSSGDAILTGREFFLSRLFLSKLEGSSGALQWTSVPGSLMSTGVNSIATDGNRDILLGGTISLSLGVHPQFMVEKVSGQDGTELWHQSLQGPFCGDAIDCNGAANSVGFDPVGDAISAGGAAPPDPTSHSRAFAVVKFSGATGEMLWSRFINGTNPGGNDLAYAMTITPEGNVVAAGRMMNLSSEVDAVIVKLDGRTGADYQPSPLRLLGALLIAVRGLNLAPGTESNLEAKLIAAKRNLEMGHLPVDACENLLTGFVHEVNALSGKQIDAADAARLVAAAQEIVEVLTAAP